MLLGHRNYSASAKVHSNTDVLFLSLALLTHRQPTNCRPWVPPTSHPVVSVYCLSSIMNFLVYPPYYNTARYLHITCVVINVSVHLYMHACMGLYNDVTIYIYLCVLILHSVFVFTSGVLIFVTHMISM